MANLEEENRLLKEANNELVQKVQYWKMTAAQRENDKLNLVKEINDLRLKLNTIRRTGDIQTQELDTALQSASQKVLDNLVRASNEITRIMDISKLHVAGRQQLNAASPRWSSLGTPAQKKDKVHRVPPLMMGGQPIQPVVSLSRAVLNTSLRSAANSNQNITARAVPMHMLQDVYIPLTRVDADQFTQALEPEPENNAENSADDLGLDDSTEREIDDESQDIQESEDFNASRVLNAVIEEDEIDTPPRRSDNPLEGPSWMLDTLNSETEGRGSIKLEPDSTTELEDICRPSPVLPCKKTQNIQKALSPTLGGHEFTPTVRRGKRLASPTFTDMVPKHRKSSGNPNRVLKVVVAKLDSSVTATPPCKLAAAGDSFDAPSPHGATVPGVIVSNIGSEDVEERVTEQSQSPVELIVKVERASRNTRRENDTRGSRETSSGSESGGERVRTRRNATKPDYRERPLNKKLRR